MASIRKEILIQEPVDIIWDALRDVGALHTRLVPGFVVDTTLEDDARIVTFANGQMVRELIVDVNDEERRVAWAIVDHPFRHYHASAEVFAESTGHSRFVWRVDLLPNELKDRVAMMMDSGLDAMRTLFGTSEPQP